MRFWVLALVLVGLAGCSGEPELTPGTLPFVESLDLGSATPVLSMESDGVTIDVYDGGPCSTVVEHVPGYGYLVDEFCPGAPSADPSGARFSTPNCPVTDFGDECQRWLPTFTVGHTVPEAAFVCLASGRAEVVDGWWLTHDEDGHEAFPLNADGVRLDSVFNELDDRMRQRCGVQDPIRTAALIEIKPSGYDLPITVELDVGLSGSFLLYSGFEPFLFETEIPTGGAPMAVMVIEGAEGYFIGEIAPQDPPTCADAVFVIDLAGPTGEWLCG